MMRKSHEKIIDEQVKRWEIMRAQKTGKEEGIPVITVSREPGSGGRIVAVSYTHLTLPTTPYV